MFEMFHAAFADAQFEVDDVIAEGGKVVVRARLTGTHQGDFMGVPASGHKISVGIADYFRIDDRTVVEHWGVMDTGALMQQLTGH
jgi:predicted ester cyclase